MGKFGDLLRRIAGNGKDDKPTEPPIRDSTGAAAPAPPAPTDSTAQEQPRHSIILRRSSLPVPEDDPARSFLGGLPRMPPDLEWPSADLYGDPRGMTFVAQIDLSEIPPFADRHLLPAAGTLYFFVSSDFDGVGDPPTRVLYFAGDPANLPARDPPPDLMTLAGSLTYYGRFWLDEEQDRAARVEFKHPLSFAVALSYGEEESERQLDAWQAAYDSGAGPEDLGELYDLVSPDNDEWPFNWAFIEHAGRALVSKIRSNPASTKMPVEFLQTLEQISVGASQWAERARDSEAFSVPPAEVAQEFRAWWRDVFRKLKANYQSGAFTSYDMQRLFKDVARYVVRLTCAHSSDAGHAIPEPFSKGVQIEAVWRRPTKYGDDINVPLHQMLGYGLPVQNAPAVHAGDVLLLQVKGDQGLAWHENVGCVLQLWIRPAELQQLRFEKVVATLECD